MKLEEIVERICKELSDLYEISLNMENGSAYVTLCGPAGFIDLPDSADKTIVEQLEDALAVADGSYSDD
jgi:hypothetical protein